MTSQPPPQQPQRSNNLQGLLSLLLPGLGQAVAGVYSRGLVVFTSVAVLSGLTIWTSARRARFPDYGLSARAFLVLLGETAALLIFFLAIYYLIRRARPLDVTTRALARVILILLAVASIGLVSDLLLDTAIPAGLGNMLYGLTELFGAAIVAAIWLWNVSDASQTRAGHVPSSSALVLLGALSLVVLGTQITEVDLPKAIREYRDTEIILRQIVWPWEAAFVYESNDVRADARVQAPCPPGETGPEPNQPQDDGPWIVVTPTCGEVSTRDALGNLEFGTPLSIVGGGFVPGQLAHVEWKNPIGNTFTPRGVGETQKAASEDGTVYFEMYIPDVVIPSVAQGPQIHTLSVVQSGQRTFTWQLSREIRLALQEMLVTIMMGMMATFVGILLSLPFSFLAARNLMSAIRSTLEGFVGGVLGLAAGVWLGSFLAGRISSLFGGLEAAPIPTALFYLVFVVGLGIGGFRIVAVLLERMARRALPGVVALALSVVGLGLIGAFVGYSLGLGFARGVLGIVYTREFAAAMSLRSGWVGAVLVGGLAATYAYRVGPTGEVTTGQLIYVGVRTLLNIVRSIEPLIWAIIGIIWVGPGPFAGFVALTVHTVAALGKLYSEAIESIEPGPIEALQATGANRLQTIVYAVFPQVLPPFIAFTIYRWDINVRLSTIIGLVGGGGIGFLLIQWIRLFQYQPAGMAVWLITITVAALDFISAGIRERFV